MTRNGQNLSRNAKARRATSVASDNVYTGVLDGSGLKYTVVFLYVKWQAMSCPPAMPCLRHFERSNDTGGFISTSFLPLRQSMLCRYKSDVDDRGRQAGTHTPSTKKTTKDTYFIGSSHPDSPREEIRLKTSGRSLLVIFLHTNIYAIIRTSTPVFFRGPSVVTKDHPISLILSPVLTLVFFIAKALVSDLPQLEDPSNSAYSRTHAFRGGDRKYK